jgi:3-oxoacyl-[acyl-carrier protein] reductase
MQALNSKVAVVTGGAGGIGSAICESLAGAGAAVVVGYNRSEPAARALAARLPAAAAAHTPMRIAVTDSAALAQVGAQVGDTYGRCDILVNCHGTTRFVPHADLDQLDDALIDEVLSTNVRGAFATVRAFRPLLAANGDGLVVNISSIAATLGQGSNVAYCASKAALDSMTRSLARALAPDIRVISVAPGFVKTEFTRHFDDAWISAYLKSTPLRRAVPPEHVGRAVLAAAVSLPSSTGIVIPVDAGRLLS